LVAAILLPRVPIFSGGVDCAALPSAEGNGTNQSVLAATVDPSSLAIQLVPDKRQLIQGEALTMNVRLYNSSMAPLTLLIAPQEAVFRYTGQENGLVFSIQEANGRVLGEPFTARQPVPVRQQYTPEVIRVLGPRNYCNLRVEFSASRLASAQVVSGQYLLTAVYRNNQPGTVPPVAPPTPTPTFRTQGVWTGEVRSAPELITIGVAQ
jgi:hypothetical protein